jgi:glycosyltransferase involved in cell wall biosynthesis
MIRKLLKNKVPKIDDAKFKSLILAVRSIREQHKTLVLYGSPTDNNWLGVANATKSLFPRNSLELPQWYSHTQLKNKQIQQICDEIQSLGYQKIIISGFAMYFFSFIEKLHNDCYIETLYHGTISELHKENTRHILEKLLRLANNNEINELAFVHQPMANAMSTLYGFKCRHQALKKPDIPKNIKRLDLDYSKCHIGVFGANTFNKNLHNQVIHALMIDNTVVHVLDKSIFTYLNMDDRIVGHGKHLSRAEFLSVLGSMDLNLYMSYSESWGLVPEESEALGVPCLRGPEINYVETIKTHLPGGER